MRSSTFDYEKATQAINYLAVRAGGQIEKLKALKLYWAADRYHLRKYSRHVVADAYYAMEYGPVASSVKDFAEDSEFLSAAEREYRNRFLRIDPGHTISSVSGPDSSLFSESDLEALDFAYDNLAHLDRWELSDLSHKYPEWKKHEEQLKRGASRVYMSIEDFFEDPTGPVADGDIFSDKSIDVGASKELYKEGARHDLEWILS